jgi:hypothetical protein
MGTEPEQKTTTKQTGSFKATRKRKRKYKSRSNVESSNGITSMLEDDWEQSATQENLPKVLISSNVPLPTSRNTVLGQRRRGEEKPVSSGGSKCSRIEDAWLMASKSKMEAEEQFLLRFAEQIEGYIDPPTGSTNIPSDENVSFLYPYSFRFTRILIMC